MAYSDDSSVSFTAPFWIGCLFPTDQELQEQEKEVRKTYSHNSTALLQQQDTAKEDEHDRQQGSYSASPPIDYNSSLFYETISCQFLNLAITIRQFDAHPTNANALWPEASFLAEWITTGKIQAGTTTTTDADRLLNNSRIHQLLISPSPSSPPMRVLELGSATGALCIYLRSHAVDITSSDIDDPIVTDNICHNYHLNHLLPRHLPHTWGTKLDVLAVHLQQHGYYHVILGSDLLAYEDSYEALADTICVLLPCYDSSHYVGGILYMCWKRRARGRGVEGRESAWFTIMRQRGFNVITHRGGIYEIGRTKTGNSKHCQSS